MKKNKSMRIASVLLVGVLLTTSIISGTFAKYVTSSEAEESARVAKFGVDISAEGKLFAKTYYSVTQDNKNEAASDGTTDTANTVLTVESDTNVVAPGTKSTGNGLTFSITGTPEVDVKINFTVDTATDIYLGTGTDLPDRTTTKADSKFNNTANYNPIVYILTDKSGATLASGTLQEIQTYLSGDNGALYVDAGTDISTTNLGTLNLTWEWPYDDTAATTLAGTLGEKYTGTNLASLADRDKKDTLLGDLAAEKVTITGTNYSTSANVKLSVSVTQVD